ncbi:MAG: iron transporter [Dehalococcoidales bacterium]|nr:iron transporter [Dehalococcoidales bacterium]|tara:strand:+ start:1165 stop:2103 length:939 start_codon:yes stop_codon:yes gene_type:complete
MSDYGTQLKTGFSAGVKRGWSSFVWMGKIIIPVSFLVALLQWTGWLSQLDFVLNPLMGLINLPPAAALPIISGMLVNIYAAIAIITVLPFTPEQITLVAVFCLIAHNLIAEGIVQHKSGLNAVKATLFRVSAAVIAVLVVSQFLGDTSQSLVASASLTVRPPFLEVLQIWGVGMISLLTKIFGIVMVIMVLLESLNSLGWMEYLLWLFRPLMRVMGLSDRSATLWVTAVAFGLLYSGAVIVEEAKKGNLTKDEMERLHISAGINHAMVEDPALFLALGLNAFWLWVPKFVMAIVAVQSYRLIRLINGKVLNF